MKPSHDGPSTVGWSRGLGSLSGDVFWVELGEPSGSAPGYRHPHVVIQNDAFNRSAIRTIVVCSVTSNLKLGAAPGNVTLRKGEAGLTKQSVVNISQIYTVDKSDLAKRHRLAFAEKSDRGSCWSSSPGGAERPGRCPAWARSWLSCSNIGWRHSRSVVSASCSTATSPEQNSEKNDRS